MIYQPPAGARDLLPLEVTQKAWINDRLQQVFQQFGYQRIVTSTIEWLDTLTAGGAIKPATVVQLRDRGEGTSGLRPELTASIARAAVTRMAGSQSYPQRLCYRANVFRTPSKSHYGRQIEYYQAGVELLFAGGILADAEIILLLARCLQDLGVPNWQILLGEAQLTRSLLAIFPPDVAERVRYCLANLDRIGLENLDLEPQLRERALFLFDLRGKPETVLEKVASLDLEPSASEIVNNLKSLIASIEQTSTIPISITLDLSLLQTIDYYTGIVFEAISFSGDRSYTLGRGGRYDGLLKLYDPQGKTSPGIGFALSIEELHSSLLTTNNLPQQPPASDWLVIPCNEEAQVAAVKYAESLRHSQPDLRVELDLGDRSPEAIREYAHNRIKNLAWVAADGTVTEETV
jgi:ATP phosphoribosyltransferase regulatory subunit